MSSILTDQQVAFIKRAHERVEKYYNPKGELPFCGDCAIAVMDGLLKIIDDLQFELDQLNK